MLPLIFLYIAGVAADVIPPPANQDWQLTTPAELFAIPVVVFVVFQGGFTVLRTSAKYVDYIRDCLQNWSAKVVDGEVHVKGDHRDEIVSDLVTNEDFTPKLLES